MLISGGVDSISAAFWLKNNFKKDFEAIHFNHRVQKANREMVAKVTKFCCDNGIKLKIITRTGTGDNSENGLRQWRLSKLKEIGGDFVTAHHSGDAMESYLMNCINGTPEYVPIPVFSNFTNFTIHHPFLLTPKRDFVSFAQANGLFRYIAEDPTNKDLKMRRNWVRNMIGAMEDKGIGLEKVVKKKFYM